MKHEVSRKQPNSKMCFVCGLKNPHGLCTAFYELSSAELVGIFTARDEHQGYPGRLHGGIATALLDETIGRAISVGQQETIWGVTLEITTRFFKPIPLGAELRVVARVVKTERRIFEGTGELLLPNGEVAATAAGKYLKLAVEKLGGFDAEGQEWRVTRLPSDPEEIDSGAADSS